MAKKQPVISDQVISDQSAEYTVGEWAGREHFRCGLCAFDTLIGRATMLTHLVDAHSSEKALEELVALETSLESTAPHDVRLKEVPPAPAAIIELSEEDVVKLIEQSKEGGDNAENPVN